MPIVTSRPRTISTTHDSENVTWPITCAVVPSPMNANAVVNSRNMPTANTSSGVTSGSSISTFAGAASRGPRQRCSPSASAVPERRRDQHRQRRQLEALLERRLQRRVVAAR